MKNKPSHCRTLAPRSPFRRLRLERHSWQRHDQDRAAAGDSFHQNRSGRLLRVQWHPGPPSLSLTTDENLLSHIETSMSGRRAENRNSWTDRAHSWRQGRHHQPVVNRGGAERRAETGSRSAKRRYASPLTPAAPPRSRLAGRPIGFIASLTGASKLNAETFQAEDVEISVTGAGQSRCHGHQFAQGGDHRSGPGELRWKSKIG